MQRRTLIGLLGACLALCAAAQDKPHPSAATAAKMRASAERLLAALPQESRGQAMRPFDDRDRTDWHYTPRNRNGLALKDMDKGERDATQALLRTALSSAGYRKAVNIIELEIVLREIETFGWMRDPERYHLTLYGTPDPAKPWGWRFEGHHLSLNFTLAGDKLAVDAPSFFGANPRWSRAAREWGCACSARSTMRAGPCSSRSPRRSAARRCSRREPTATS
jgi:hypothetical protein